MFKKSFIQRIAKSKRILEDPKSTDKEVIAAGIALTLVLKELNEIFEITSVIKELKETFEKRTEKLRKKRIIYCG